MADKNRFTKDAADVAFPFIAARVPRSFFFVTSEWIQPLRSLRPAWRSSSLSFVRVGMWNWQFDSGSRYAWIFVWFVTFLAAWFAYLWWDSFWSHSRIVSFEWINQERRAFFSCYTREKVGLECESKLDEHGPERNNILKCIALTLSAISGETIERRSGKIHHHGEGRWYQQGQQHFPIQPPSPSSRGISQPGRVWISARSNQKPQ